MKNFNFTFFVAVAMGAVEAVRLGLLVDGPAEEGEPAGQQAERDPSDAENESEASVASPGSSPAPSRQSSPPTLRYASPVEDKESQEPAEASEEEVAAPVAAHPSRRESEASQAPVQPRAAAGRPPPKGRKAGGRRPPKQEWVTPRGSSRPYRAPQGRYDGLSREAREEKMRQDHLKAMRERQEDRKKRAEKEKLRVGVHTPGHDALVAAQEREELRKIRQRTSNVVTAADGSVSDFNRQQESRGVSRPATHSKSRTPSHSPARSAPSPPPPRARFNRNANSPGFQLG